jgi:hypothetical protein
MKEHDVTWKKNSKLSKASCDSKKCLSVTRSPSFASDCPTRNSSAASDCLTRIPSDASIVSRFTSFAADSEEDSEEEGEEASGASATDDISSEMGTCSSIYQAYRIEVKKTFIDMPVSDGDQTPTIVPRNISAPEILQSPCDVTPTTCMSDACSESESGSPVCVADVIHDDVKDIEIQEKNTFIHLKFSEQPPVGRTKSAPGSLQTPNPTTIMIRNIPHHWARCEVVELLERKDQKGHYNFVYVPMNFRTSTNFGYAFVNLRNTHFAMALMEILAKHEDEELYSDWSSYQGKVENIERFRNNSVMHRSVRSEWKPALYDTEGNEISFPEPTRRIPKPRIHWNKKGGEQSLHSQD